MSTLQTIQQMIVEQFELNIDDLVPDATLESLGLDSLSVIEFMFNIEDKYHIKMANELLENIKTLQDVVQIIDKLVAEQHPAGN
jgi:acyl carrier protein